MEDDNKNEVDADASAAGVAAGAAAVACIFYSVRTDIHLAPTKNYTLGMFPNAETIQNYFLMNNISMHEL